MKQSQLSWASALVIILCSLLWSCQSQSSSQDHEEVGIERPVTSTVVDSQELLASQSYQYYQNWKNIAKILFYDEDSTSQALYHLMVSSLEQIKNGETERTTEEVFVALSNSFRTLESPDARRQIDSLLVNDGQAPFYQISPTNPKP